MKSKLGFLPEDAGFPFKGLDLLTPTTQMAAGSSPNAINLKTFRGLLQKRSGYAQLGAYLGLDEPIIRLINFKGPDQVNRLIACTLSKFYSYNGTSWTDVTPTAYIAKFDKLSAGNGWSITSGTFVVGEHVFQSPVSQSLQGAHGQWLTEDSSYYYIAVIWGVFDVATAISQRAVDGVYSILGVSGTTASSVTWTRAKFAVLAAGNGWSVSDGAFAPGDTVVQAGSGATGRWIVFDTAGYYILKDAASAAFNSTGDVTNTSTGRSGTMSLTGVKAVTTASVEMAALDSGTTKLSSTGTEDNYIDYTIGADETHGQCCVVTNGVNTPVLFFASSGALGSILLKINIDRFATAKSVGILNSYLVFGNIVTRDDHEPRAMVWCDTGNFHEWELGNAGEITELAQKGDILRLIPYGGKLIIFTEGSIGALVYIDPSVIFGTQVYISDINIVGANAICSVNPFLVYTGHDNLYIWDGGATVSPIGDAIAPFWRDIRNETYLARTALFYDAVSSQVRFIIPTGSLSNRVLVMEIALSSATFYDIDKSSKVKWFEHSYAVRASSFGLYTPSSTELHVTMGSDHGLVFSEDDEVNDKLQSIPITWETHDFVIPQVYQSQYARWMEFEFEALGTEITISYSIDRGETWTEVGDITLDESKLMPYKAYLDVTSKQIRYRFYSDARDSAFQLTWYRTWLRAGGAR